MAPPVKAIGMISGGLDSTLALALVKRQGIEVKAVNFYTGFCITETQRRKGGRQDGSVPRNEALRAGADLEVEVEYVDISGDAYLDLIVNPRHGYGSNANPCVDCRIFMMRRAREIMEREGAAFVFTGEVVGQRPKSQKRQTMRLIEREAGLTGRLVRPLSAQLLEPSIPEKEGLLDRSRLLDISGRSRQRQIRLARELGLEDWPQPAGGCCYLTDESFSRKFFDILESREAAGEPRAFHREDAVLLTTGRHFRLGPAVKLVVGRTEVENVTLDEYGEGRGRLMARDLMGPVALLEGQPTREELVAAARIVARYGKGKDHPAVAVEWRAPGGAVEVLEVEPWKDEAWLESARI